MDATRRDGSFWFGRDLGHIEEPGLTEIEAVGSDSSVLDVKTGCPGTVSIAFLDRRFLQTVQHHFFATATEHRFFIVVADVVDG